VNFPSKIKKLTNLRKEIYKKVRFLKKITKYPSEGSNGS
jgi:hypothetical protein